MRPLFPSRIKSGRGDPPTTPYVPRRLAPPEHRLQFAYNGICGVIGDLKAAGREDLAAKAETLRAELGPIAFPKLPLKDPEN